MNDRSATLNSDAPKNSWGVSAIICTYNRSRFVARMLESIAAQLPLDFAYEIVVVDNNSTDDTRAVVEGLAGNIPFLKYVFEREQGLSRARNRGAQEAAFEYLIYLDDDAVLVDGFLRNLGQVLQQHDPDLYGGPIFPLFADPKPSWFPEELEIRSKALVSGFSHSVTLSGGSFGIKRSVLKRLGGFDPTLGMIGRRMGLLEERALIDEYRATTPADLQKVFYIVECTMLHHTPKEKMRLWYQLRRAFLANYVHAKIHLQRDCSSPTIFFAAARHQAIRNSFGEFWHLLSRSRDGRVSAVDWVKVAVSSALRLGTAAGALSFLLTGRKTGHLTQSEHTARQRPTRALYVADGEDDLSGGIWRIEPQTATLIEAVLGDGVALEVIKAPTIYLQKQKIMSKNLSNITHIIFESPDAYFFLAQLRLAYPHLKLLVHVPRSCLRNRLARWWNAPSLSKAAIRTLLIPGGLRRDYLVAKYADCVVTNSPYEAHRYWPLITGRKKIKLVSDCSSVKTLRPIEQPD